MERKLLFFTIVLIQTIGYSQKYQIFKENRITFLKGKCTNSKLPAGQEFITAPYIYVSSDHDYIEIVTYPGVLNRPISKVFYGLENMLCGITLNPSRPLINTCYEDSLNSFSIIPRRMSIKLTTPTSNITGDNSTGDEVTLTGSKGYHELVYNWQVYIPLEIAGVLENPGDKGCVLNSQGGDDDDDDDGFKIKTGSSRLGWVNLPNKYLGKEEISFTAEDLFGSNAVKVAGKSLKFRIGMSNGWNSNILPFSFILSSPKLVSLTPQATTCNYKKDGKFKLKMSRDLIEETALTEREKLVVAVFFKDDTNKKEGYSLYGSEDTSSLIKEIDGTYSYSWSGNLPTGEYKIKYQTIKKKKGEKGNSLVWDTIELSKKSFKILQADKVNFTATKFSDETCFGAKNGKIKLDITSGETSKYKYIIYEVNGTSVTLYRNWITFTGPTTIIENLDKKTEYRIKVQDTKGCFARK